MPDLPDGWTVEPYNPDGDDRTEPHHDLDCDGGDGDE
jgi:hypothetical protein